MKNETNLIGWAISNAGQMRNDCGVAKRPRQQVGRFASKCDRCVTKKEWTSPHWPRGAARTPPSKPFLGCAIWNNKYCAVFANAPYLRGEHAHICREKGNRHERFIRRPLGAFRSRDRSRRP